MQQKHRNKVKGRAAKSVLRLPDLEVAKSAVLSSLSCPDAQRGYRHAIAEFVDGTAPSRAIVQQGRGRSVLLPYYCAGRTGTDTAPPSTAPQRHPRPAISS